MFRVLRSSAGSGKTHTLVKHYIALCLKEGRPDAYRHVLALTFTNKAAGEMRDRVIDYLERLALHELGTPAMRDVMEHLMRDAGAGEEAIAGRAAQVLEHMLHHWGEAAISTIDAFTRRVVRPFARDLRLDHELRTTTEEEWYRHRAVDDVVAQAGRDAGLTGLLSAAAMQLLDDARHWDPGEPLRQLSGELAKERSIRPLAGMEQLDADAVLEAISRMKRANDELRAHARQLGTEALALIEAQALTPKDLHQGPRGFHSYLEQLAEFRHAWTEPNTFALKALENDTWSSGSIAPGARARLEGIAPEIRKAITSAMDLLANGQRAYFVRSAVLRELPAAFALRELGHCLEQRKRDDGVVFFSDLTRRVADLVRDEPAPFIFERLGERYRHYLIDEFQDTSMLQWATLLPLVQNALATGGSALLVGDAKQAIYRWRNGEARLFLELPGLFGSTGSALDRERESALRQHHRPIAPLTENHRSARNIIAFNNALFSRLRNYLPPALRPIYDDHEQQARKPMDGLVHLARMEKELTSDDAAAQRHRFILDSVAEALADGFAPGDIAVLVRSNKQGREAADALSAQGHRVSSPDGLLLTGDPVVESIIALMHVLWRDDRTAAAKAVQWMAMLDSPTERITVDPYADRSELADPLAIARGWLSHHGISGVRTTLTALISALLRGLRIDPASDARALALLDEAHSFALQHGPSLPGFLQHWERMGSKRSLAPVPDQHAIQVMTIHKAKGLEFPVVILPSTKLGGDGQNDRLWLESVKEETGIAHALVKSSKLLRESGIAELQQEEDLALLDGLDLLYVAFTRPVQRLYALAHAYKPDAATKGVLEWMVEHGDPQAWIDGERTGPWKQGSAAEGEYLAAGASGGAAPELSIRIDAPAEWDASDPDRATRLGNAAHLALGRMRTSADLGDAIRAALGSGLLDATEARELEQRLAALLAREDIAAWFGGTWQTRNESAIIAANGHVLRPDRVLLSGSTARVLDYKTGSPSEAHADQVRGYLRVLQAMGYARVEGALLYLSTGELKQVDP